MGSPSGTVLSVSSRALLVVCERLGLDTEAMLRSVGISRQTLGDPGARLEASKVRALWARAYELSGDPVLSLHAAEACPLGAYKVIDFMASSAGTVGEAFCNGSRYFGLIWTGCTPARSRAQLRGTEGAGSVPPPHATGGHA
jgi:hypothetical protein